MIDDDGFQETIALNYSRVDPQNAFDRSSDGDYARHELAHFVVLFGRAPMVSKHDLQPMQWWLDVLTIGRAQLHELRVVKLQSLVLGEPAEVILDSVWFGIVDVADDNKGGQDIVTTKNKAVRLMGHIRVSQRLIRAYCLALKRFGNSPPPLDSSGTTP